MQSSVTGRKTEHGFTLIELIVVVSIVSVLALSLGLSTGPVIDRNRPGSASHIASTLVRDVEAARSRAFHHRQLAGLVPQAQGWALVSRAPDSEDWSSPQREETISGRLQWRVGGASYLPPVTPPDDGAAPVIRFLADGRATPFQVTVTGRGGALQVCETDGLEPLSCQAR